MNGKSCDSFPAAFKSHGACIFLNDIHHHKKHTIHPLVLHCLKYSDMYRDRSSRLNFLYFYFLLRILNFRSNSFLVSTVLVLVHVNCPAPGETVVIKMEEGEAVAVATSAALGRLIWRETIMLLISYVATLTCFPSFHTSARRSNADDCHSRCV